MVLTWNSRWYIVYCGCIGLLAVHEAPDRLGTFDNRSVSSASRRNQLPLCGYVQRDSCDRLIHYASILHT